MPEKLGKSRHYCARKVQLLTGKTSLSSLTKNSSFVLFSFCMQMDLQGVVGPSLVDQVKIAFENEIEFLGSQAEETRRKKTKGEIGQELVESNQVESK